MEIKYEGETINLNHQYSDLEALPENTAYLEKHILKKKNKFTLKYSVQSESDSLIIGNDYRIGSINKINGDENWVVKFETPIVSYKSFIFYLL